MNISIGGNVVLMNESLKVLSREMDPAKIRLI
jgi:hypothetical protein